VAARILAHAPRTEAELHARLVAKGYQPGTAATTVARCRELGYVGDEKYASERARSMRLRGAGSLKIAADLEARGLPESMVAAAVEASLEGLSEIDWAKRALGKGGASGPAAWRLLAGKGFPEDVIADLLSDLE
jgi:regulatory protein